ncbi:GntR family transcriptional regulator [Cellulosilyticum ruminicola]|uniref:GntR family transcriptional regulator n=1 Tax=Cellulosilyticum ruminicola TaxID=425254 RepID=UPI000AFF1F67|nr:GntR family transcriptional regulator [Cellulosilyticum ruminicola]
MDSILREVQNGIECFRKVGKIYCIPLYIAHMSEEENVIYESDSIDKSSLRERVFQTIRQSILNGKYKSGDTLRESAIANELNVSRTPVREAIRQLQLEGLVHSIPNKETVVCGITEEDVQDIFMVRGKLEGIAGRLAAERITEEELEKMEEILELTEFYASKGDITKLENLDHTFHDVIYNATKSKIIKQVLSDFHMYIQQARKKSMATPGRVSLLIEEHRGIYEAIKNRDGDKAEELINAHLKKVINNIHLS